jgi:hypothetical protein
MHRLRVYFNRNTWNGKYTNFFLLIYFIMKILKRKHNWFGIKKKKERKRVLLVYNMLEKKNDEYDILTDNNAGIETSIRSNIETIRKDNIGHDTQQVLKESGVTLFKEFFLGNKEAFNIDPSKLFEFFLCNKLVH